MIDAAALDGRWDSYSKKLDSSLSGAIERYGGNSEMYDSHSLVQHTPSIGSLQENESI